MGQKETRSVLLLGMPSSGKSTLVKVAKLATSSYDNVEMTDITDSIRAGIITGVQEIISASERLDITLKSENRKKARYVRCLPPDASWESNLTLKLKELWADNGVQQTLLEIPHFQIHQPHFKYWMNNIERVSDSLYTPSREDILRVRHRTTGIVVTNLRNSQILGANTWRLLDAGGSSSERSKWSQIVQQERNTLYKIVFFASLDEYDLLPTIGDYNKTALTLAQENFGTFMQTIPSDIPVVLFLNKFDVFSEQIEKDPKSFFRQFNTYPKKDKRKIDPLKAANHVASTFIADSLPNRDCVSVYVGSAINEESMHSLFEIKKNKKDSEKNPQQTTIPTADISTEQSQSQSLSQPQQSQTHSQSQQEEKPEKKDNEIKKPEEKEGEKELVVKKEKEKVKESDNINTNTQRQEDKQKQEQQQQKQPPNDFISANSIKSAPLLFIREPKSTAASEEEEDDEEQESPDQSPEKSNGSLTLRISLPTPSLSGQSQSQIPLSPSQSEVPQFKKSRKTTKQSRKTKSLQKRFNSGEKQQQQEKKQQQQQQEDTQQEQEQIIQTQTQTQTQAQKAETTD